MFLPGIDEERRRESALAQRRDAFQRIEQWSMEAVPSDIREGLQISIQEVQCGDPNCAPLDTAVAILFPSGGRGMFGLPMEAKDVTLELLMSSFPTESILRKWANGEEAEWPPLEDLDMSANRPNLRFSVGDRVECRIGADPVTGWASGTIIQLWYREPNWPENSWAPYKIKLDNDMNIFAPGDVDQIIRRVSI